MFFFGCLNPYDHAEFKGVVHGFNLRLARTARGKKTTFLHHWDDLATVQRSVLAIYNRRVHSVEDIVRRLQFRTPFNFAKVECLRREIFQLRLLRWLRGVGWPRSLRGKFVNRQDYRAQRQNPLLRAESLLYSMTGMRVLPTDPDFTLTVRHQFSPFRAFAKTASFRWTLSGSSTKRSRPVSDSMTAAPPLMSF